MSCGVGCRCGSDPALLWPWRRQVAEAPILPLAWEPPYATGAAQGEKKSHFQLNLLFILLFRAAPATYGSSQARGLIGAAAAGLCQSHRNAGSEPRLQPTPALTATPDA